MKIYPYSFKQRHLEHLERWRGPGLFRLPGLSHFCGLLTLRTNSIRKILHLGFILLLLFPGFLPAQQDELPFERIGRAQGLTASSVLSILQDRQGFMWFGTTDGLFRFDGYGMKVYKHDRLDSTSLGNNNIFTILEDHTGVLWLGTAGGGLNRFDRGKEQFVRYRHDPDNPNSLSADVVSALFEDRSGALWAGTWEGLNRIDLGSGEITRFVNDPENPSSMSPYWVRSISQDSAGTLWVGTDGGLSRLDRETGEFTHFVEGREKPGGLWGAAVLSIYSDRAGNLWIGSWGALNLFDPRQSRFTQFLNNSVILCLHEDRAGTFWIGTNRRLFHLASTRDVRIYQNREVNRYFAQKYRWPRREPLFQKVEIPTSFESYTINQVYEDNTGVIWIATDNGVYRYDRGQHRFKHLVHDPDNPNSLSQNRIRGMVEDSAGTIWVGTQAEGLARYDPRTGQFQYAFPGLENQGLTPGPQRNYAIFGLHMDRSGVLWIGQGIGLGRYDPKQGQFERFVYDAEDSTSLSGNSVLSIHEDHTGALWVGSYHPLTPGGLDRLDDEHKRFTRFDLNPDKISARGDGAGSAGAIAEGRTGRLWFATYGGGVCLFDRDSETFTRFTHIPGDTNSLSHGWVGAIHEDREGMLWAAPWYGGLNKLDPETGRITIYTGKDGLPSDYITGIVEDDRGRLWLTTLNGLSRFDPRTETFKNFDDSDGLLNTEFSSENAGLKTRTGELYFGAENGIDYVHPDSIRDNPYVPPVVFTRFARYNSADSREQAIVEKGISQKRRLELSYRDRILSFEFAALNYRAPQKNQYAYKLEGFNDDWIQLGSQHDVTFTNLDPGEYTLRVKGSNNDGVWNEAGASLVISISPPWWQTAWAYTFYILMFVGALYGIRRFELNRHRLRSELKMKAFQAQKLQEVDRMKSRFFADISHEFRTPLTLILGPLQKLLSPTAGREQREVVSLMQRNARRLQRLVDQLLDLSRLEAHRMPLRARPEDIVQKIREWVASFASLAENRGIALNFDLPSHPVIVYFEADKLEKVIFNLLGNASKFTPAGGEITVRVDTGSFDTNPGRVSSGLFITIKDTGIGIPEEHIGRIFERFHRVSDALTGEQGGTGIGLALAKELIELHHGEIQVESEVGRGSTFTVILPLGREHLSDEEIYEPVAEQKPTQPALPAPGPLPARAALAEVDTGKAKSRRPLVLIVEDNPDMRRYLTSCLSAAFALVDAENGAAGYQLACKKSPDLIVSDVMMPVLDGFALCEKLKTDARTSHIPVILLTARAGQEDKLEGLETGADDYLTKPFDARELQVRVKNLIAQRRKLHERFRRELLVQPSEIAATSMDEKFLQQAITIVEANLSDSDFQLDHFCRRIAMSRSTLNRKLRALTGLSTNGFIRTLRLKRAAQLLEKKSATVVEIAYEVGFNNPSYFAECFRQQFGTLPSEYTAS